MTTATKTPRRVVSLQSKYDAAETTRHNAKHWQMADMLSANASNSPDIRALIRSRARYEIANNSWAKGMVLTLAKATIGKGPRLQLNTTNRELNRKAEVVWLTWMKRIRLAAKLRTMRMSRVGDGAGCGLIGVNKGIDLPTNVDLRLIEDDQIASPDRFNSNRWGDNAEIVDGVEYDAFGNPVAYYILPSHPGSDASFDIKPRRIDARQIIYWQRNDRPGPHRAIAEISPALGLFAQLRRYTLSTVDAAEVAADNAYVVYTDNLPPDEGPADVKESGEFGTIEFERRMATFLPEGWKPSQMKPEQPTTVYDAFVKSLINEIGRCMEMPLNIASGNSGGYNFASGRLDSRSFDKFVDVERDDCEIVVVDRLFSVWIRQLTLLTEFTEWRGQEDFLSHQFHWDSYKPVDEFKAANAAVKLVGGGLGTEATHYAAQGYDWEVQQEQWVREKLNIIRIAKEMSKDFDMTEEEAVAVVAASRSKSSADVNELLIEKED